MGQGHAYDLGMGRYGMGRVGHGMFGSRPARAWRILAGRLEQGSLSSARSLDGGRKRWRAEVLLLSPRRPSCCSHGQVPLSTLCSLCYRL